MPACIQIIEMDDKVVTQCGKLLLQVNQGRDCPINVSALFQGGSHVVGRTYVGDVYVFLQIVHCPAQVRQASCRITLGRPDSPRARRTRPLALSAFSLCASTMRASGIRLTSIRRMNVPGPTQSGLRTTGVRYVLSAFRSPRA